ncbi:MAG: aminoacetone oxidase family FAD-binding enzyme [Eubacterium sp.]|nr:aminoacetone oxidase family FAD-binding enzyme [Eubacterium sp.]
MRLFETMRKDTADKKQYDIIVIGAGASGMTAALTAARAAADPDSLRILLLEKQKEPGRKLLVTGNGKCNLTNTLQEPSCYRSSDPERAWQIICRYGGDETFDFFKRIGLVTRRKEGYVYPYSEQAAGVRRAFADALSACPSVRLMTDIRVKALKNREDGYLAVTDRGNYYGSSVIIASGGYAGPDFGCQGDGYRMAGSLGIPLVRPLPALTSLKSRAPFLRQLSGLRCRASVRLMAEEACLCRDEGEVQWTGYGISGVVIFQVSRYAAAALEEGKKVSLLLDFMPERDEDGIRKLLTDMAEQNGGRSMEGFLSGFFHEKLVPVLIHEAGLTSDRTAGDMSEKDRERLAATIKAFPLFISGYSGYEKAQVTQGGIPLSAVSSRLESLDHPGLFFAGEVLDVEGQCGGYNLQWAFASGMAAGRGAIERNQTL